MGRFKRAWQWVEAADTTLSLLDMALRVIGLSTVLSALAGLITWPLVNPYAALVVGLGTWIAIAILLLLIMARRAKPSTPSEPRLQEASQRAPMDNGPPKTVDWRALRLSIPTTENAQEQLMTLASENKKLPSPDPVIELLADSERARVRLEDERDGARAEVERLKTENKQLRAQIPQPDDKELKQRCRKLVAELSAFTDERAQGHPQKAAFWPNPKETTRYNNETKAQYDRRFRLDVAIVLDALERRGCRTNPAERKKFENPNMARNIQNLQALVQRLAVLCERL